MTDGKKPEPAGGAPGVCLGFSFFDDFVLADLQWQCFLFEGFASVCYLSDRGALLGFDFSRWISGSG